MTEWSMLPTPVSWFKKTLAILKSNLSPNQIAFAFALGVYAGLPPTGLHIIIPCTLALFFRCSFRSFLISMGLFRLISFALAPGAYAIGQWLLDPARGLDGLWRGVFHLPVFAPMGYDRYLLFGSLALAFPLSIPVFLLVRLLVQRYRGQVAPWIAGWRVSQQLKDRPGTRLVLRLLAGGRAKYDAQPVPRGVFRIVRRGMLVGVPIAYAVAYLLAAVIVPFLAGPVATSTASWIVGSEVAISGSSFSLFTGTLTLDDLAIQDPNAPSENLIEIPEITLDAGLIHLIENRVIFDRVRIADASLHVVREEDGTLNLDNATSGWNAAQYADWAVEHADNVDWLGLLRRFVDSLSDRRPLPPRGDPYAVYSGGRSFEAFKAPFAVERLEIGRITVSLRDDHAVSAGPLPPLTLLEIELTNFALPADLRTGPVSLRLHGQLGDRPDSGFTLSAAFSLADQTATTEYNLELTRIDLARWAAVYETTIPATVLSGRATATLSVTLTRNTAVDDPGTAAGTVTLLVEDLRLGGNTEQPLFGLPDETSNGVIEGINRYAAEGPIVIGFPIGGTQRQPTFEWEAPLLEIAQQGLLMVGEREAERIAEELGLRIDALGGLPTAALAADHETVQLAAQDAAADVLSEALSSAGVRGENAETQTNSSTAEDVVRSLIDQLLPSGGGD